ncbi:MAG: TRAP transporter small permease [Epsilonproteobacteria bacterium]|nr:TRAP transporter small permease [Campylobacterota bacterium]
MKFICKLSDKLQTFGAYLSSLLFIALTLLILTEIVARSFFNVSTMIADEYSGYFYLAAIFIGLGYTFKEDGHIRINVLTSRLSKKANRYIDIFAGSITLVLILFILYNSILMVKESYEYDMVSETVSETPIYLTQLAMPIGLFLFALAVLSFILRRIANDK